MSPPIVRAFVFLTGTLLEIDFWNVGQGDCTVIKLPNGRLIIIDVGPRGSPLVQWLREGTRRQTAIEAIVLTHNDAEHAGSFPVLVNEFKQNIGAIWMLADHSLQDPKFLKIFRAAHQGESEGYYKINRLEDGHILWNDDQTTTCLRVIHPTMSQNVLANDPNDTSGMVVLDVEGKNLVTWPGDLQLTKTAEVLQGHLRTIGKAMHPKHRQRHPSESIRPWHQCR